MERRARHGGRMRTLKGFAAAQRRYDDMHPDDLRGPWDDAAEEGAACMRDFDRREAERDARHMCSECNGCGTLNGRDSCRRCAGSRPSGTIACTGRECEICGRPAQEMGSEARCSDHDSEGDE